jgi:hypothetical protein
MPGLLFGANLMRASRKTIGESLRPALRKKPETKTLSWLG